MSAAPANDIAGVVTDGQKLRVGFIGAGSVVRSIHVPALAHLAHTFEISAVWDLNSAAATSLAEQVGCRIAASLDELLADPEIDLIAVCSPAAAHAEHVIAALRAGKRGIFVEKPLATTMAEANEVAAVARATNIPVIVGAMHLFDPGWTAVAAEVAELRAEAHHVRSSLVIPFNARFLQWAIEGPPRAKPPARSTDLESRLRYIRSGMLELAIHDMPLIRRLIPEGCPVRVTSAEVLLPVGYAVTLDAGDRVVELFGYMNDQWQPRWEIEAVSKDKALTITFTPSFVAAGGAVATVEQAGSTVRHESRPANGYYGEWLALAEAVTCDRSDPQLLDGLLNDLEFAISIADQACDFLARESGR